MSNIKLFQFKDDNSIIELTGKSVQLERSLQSSIEANLEGFLGVRFLATEYPKEKLHKCRIDTLGIDRNGCPVIIEYKRSINENVISQGLYYLGWLLDHKSDFKILVREQLADHSINDIDWKSPRILCIAEDFTKYDLRSAEMISQYNIELIRYKKYDEGFMILELINAIDNDRPSKMAKSILPPTIPDLQEIRNDIASIDDSSPKTFNIQLHEADKNIKDLFDNIKSYILNLGNDLQEKEIELYFIFKRGLDNFASIAIDAKTKIIKIYTKSNTNLPLIEGFTKDVSKDFCPDDLEITIRSIEDFENAKKFLNKNYEK
jgi:predicted transport protein